MLRSMINVHFGWIWVQGAIGSILFSFGWIWVQVLIDASVDFVFISAGFGFRACSILVAFWVQSGTILVPFWVLFLIYNTFWYHLGSLEGVLWTKSFRGGPRAAGGK